MLGLGGRAYNLGGILNSGSASRQLPPSVGGTNRVHEEEEEEEVEKPIGIFSLL